MTTVAELLPGQIVDGPDGAFWATFVAQTEHPLWPHLRLVVWRVADSWSHDALDARQYVGTARASTEDERRTNLRRALLHRSQW